MALRSVCDNKSTNSSDNALTMPSPVANDQGSFTTPSFVSFTAEERLIGEAAKNQAAMNPINTVFDVK
jgi:molecular chaperone DnaK (HSP70)